MRKINMKKLNNKGFTLIELLAVIVILAVVMGVAASQVLNAMNNSRKSSLQNSALSAADAFRTAYAEYSMGGQEKLMGYSKDDTKALLNGTPKNLTAGDVAKQLNITVGTDGTSGSNYVQSTSWVYFNKTNSSFTVCLTANTAGSYYVANAVGKSYSYTESPVQKPMTSGTMWACSDNTHSWS